MFVVIGLCVRLLWWCDCCSLFVNVVIDLCPLLSDWVCSCWFVFGVVGSCLSLLVCIWFACCVCGRCCACVVVVVRGCLLLCWSLCLVLLCVCLLLLVVFVVVVG